MNPLTREEVAKWPALGPMNLDPARVLALLDRLDEVRRIATKHGYVDAEGKGNLFAFLDLALGARRPSTPATELAHRKAKQEAERERDEALTHAQLLKENLSTRAAECEHYKEHVGTLETQVADLNLEVAKVEALLHESVSVSVSDAAMMRLELSENNAVLSKAVETLRAERDEARKELDDLALAVGMGEHPAGQGHVVRASGTEMAKRWLGDCAERDHLRDFKAYVHKRVISATRVASQTCRSGCRTGCPLGTNWRENQRQR